MEIERPFSSISTIEKHNDDIFRRAKREFEMSPKKFFSSSASFISENIRSAVNRGSESCSYSFFRIPEPLYDNLEEVTFHIHSTSDAIVYINSYRVDKCYSISKGTNKISVHKNKLELGHNTMAYVGDISIQKLIFSVDIHPDISTPSVSLPAENAYIKAAIWFILESVIDGSPESELSGSCYALYDYENKCYRKPYWLWNDAPIVNVLLKYGDEMAPYMEIAKKMCCVFCNHRNYQDQNGALVSRYERFGQPDHPYECLVGPNDASFIVRWALLPMYEKTNDEVYKQISYQALSWIVDCIKSKDFVPSHYYVERGEWEPKAFVDTGFTPIGFLQYDLVENISNGWRDSVKLFMDRFVEQFQLDSSFYGQNYSPREGLDKKIFSRGQAWVLAGLIATYKLTRENKYLEMAIDVGLNLVREQNNSGGWSYLLGYNIPKDKVKRMSGECEKATAVITYYLLKLYDLYSVDDMLSAAQDGIKWCERNMVFTENYGFGGISSKNLYSGINGNAYLEMATGYANAYYVLAKREYRSIDQS